MSARIWRLRRRPFWHHRSGAWWVDVRVIVGDNAPHNWTQKVYPEDTQTDFMLVK